MMGKKKNVRKGVGSHLLRKLYSKSHNKEDKEGKKESYQPNMSPILNVYHPSQKTELAQVRLNGYNIDQTGTFGSLGAMRSFKIIEGDLWDEWNEQTAVILTDNGNHTTLIKVAALPTEEGAFGLLEFVSLNE